MLIKEYRICIPLSVQEYRIAQLYMIQKKSREESTGSGSGVQILENEPYTDGPGGNGQYTFKIYHIGSHLPGWFRAILPKSALRVEEEAWNAYPYTKTRYRCPFVEKFSLEIETIYKNDDGSQENVFGLPEEERQVTQIDFIDMVKDPISAGDYRREEDPKLFVSNQTGRGPLDDDWREQYSEEMREKGPAGCSLMCAYKVCRVEFKYWGMQGKLERFIHDIALRKTMLRAHRQAWCWQDEWYGLTIEDIRRLELETAKALAEKMAKLIAEEDNGQTSAGGVRGEARLPSTAESEEGGEREEAPAGADSGPRREESARMSSGFGEKSLETLHAQSSSDDEFYDAKDMMDIETSSYVTCRSGSTLLRRSSLEYEDFDPLEATTKDLVVEHVDGSQTSRKSVLFLVVHGGSLLDTSHEYHNKNVDISTMRSNFENVVARHYSALAGRLSVKLVAAPPIVTSTLTTLNDINPCAADIVGHSRGDSESLNDFLPLGAIPLFFTASNEYEQLLVTTAFRLNQRYAEFLASDEGRNFKGPVCLIGDSVGSIIAYDILCRCPPGKIDLGSRGSLQSCGSGQSGGEFGGSGEGGRTEEGGGGGPDGRSVSNPDLPEITADGPSGEALSQSFTHSPRGRLAVPRSLSMLEFEVADFFMLGSPLPLLLAYRRSQGNALKTPGCRQVYNLFHSTDPSSYRLEPLMEAAFSRLAPIRVPRYARYPLGDGQALSVLEAIIHHHAVFAGDAPTARNEERPPAVRQNSLSSSASSGDTTEFAINFFATMRKRWWGNKRVDFILNSPEVLQSFPVRALPHMHHASYWESHDVASFVLRQTVSMFGEDVTPLPHPQLSDDLAFVPSHPREKWRNRGNSIKLKAAANASPNHRANDVMVLDGKPQILSARFSYGPLDMLSLTGEMVDVHIMSQPPAGTWEYLGTEVTDSNGRAHFRIPEQRRLPVGMYPVKMVVRADHSTVDFTLAVLPPKTEVVVFSVDGSFAASVSIMGRDPKVRPGGVDVVRHWQELGYLLIYITARPDMQQRRVVRWLAQHNFPRGMVLFMSGLTAEPLRQKANCLQKLMREVDIRIHCAYGSAKDISVYRPLGLQANQIFIVGRASKKQAANSTILSSGYASHLNTLRSGHEATRRAQGSARIIIHKACFGLPTKAPPSLKGLLSGKKVAKRTASCPASAAPSPALLDPNRTWDGGPLTAPPPGVAGPSEGAVGGGTPVVSKLRGLSPKLKLF